MLSGPLRMTPACPRIAWIFYLLLTLSTISTTQADRDTDVARLGTELSSMPLYRSGAGTNVLRVSVGTPGVEMDLTCSTNVDYLVVAATGCEECVHDADLLSTSGSSSLTISQEDLAYTFAYPAGSSATLSIAGRFATDLIADERGDDSTARPVVLAAAVQADDPDARLSGSDIRLTDGTAGFWGMGVDQERKAQSMIHSMISADNDDGTQQVTSFTVGFEINNYSTSTSDQAGTIHWGAVPAESYEGEFNWLSTDRAVGGSWGFDLDRLRVGDEVIDLEANYGTIDPAFDAIYVPNAVAESVHAHVDGATRDPRNTERWNVPCDTQIDLRITISGVQYAVASSQLVQPRDQAGRTCWSSVVAWQNGSVPEQRAEVRLGTPFMAGIYSAFYYSDSEQYVGLAGKPNSVNAHNLFSRAEGKPNMQLAGILIGTLLGVLLILFVICYARNRSSFQSIWYRALRRQQRVQMNAVVRGATLPPPMMAMAMPMPMPMGPGGMPPPGMGGPMMPMPMAGPGPGVPHASMGGMMPTPMAGYAPVPPPYQQPMSRKMVDPTHGQDQQGYQQTPRAEQHQPLLSPAMDGRLYPQAQQMPPTVQPQQHGYYSPRLQPTSPPKSRSGFMPFPILGKSRSADKLPNGYGYGPEPPVSGGSKVRFGPTAARQMRSASSAGASTSVNEFGAMMPPMSDGAHGQGYGGPSGRHARQEEFMRQYANAAQHPQHQYDGSPPGYHQHLPHSYGNQTYGATETAHAQGQGFGGQEYTDGYGEGALPPLAEVPNGTYLSPAHASGSPGRGEKKRYFAWRGGSPKQGGGGGYEAVSNPAIAPGQGQGQGQGKRGRSWFLGGGGGADTWKDVERRHETEQREADRARRGLGWS
ncbi:hypothetical protein IAU59_004739 [Kwoniella sp. CBS 9459]